MTVTASCVLLVATAGVHGEAEPGWLDARVFAHVHQEARLLPGRQARWRQQHRPPRRARRPVGAHWRRRRRRRAGAAHHDTTECVPKHTIPGPTPPRLCGGSADTRPGPRSPTLLARVFVSYPCVHLSTRLAAFAGAGQGRLAGSARRPHPRKGHGTHAAARRGGQQRALVAQPAGPQRFWLQLLVATFANTHETRLVLLVHSQLSDLVV